MKKFEHYQNVTLPWPSKPSYKRYNVFIGPQVLGLGLLKQEADKLVEENPGAEYVSYFLEKEYNAARKAHNAEAKALEQEFERDIFEEFGVTGHPKADKVMSLAWARGHSEGLHSVYAEFVELVELIQP